MDVGSIEARPNNYPPVDIDPSKEIRILELLPGHFDDEIQCKLLKHALNVSEPQVREYYSEVDHPELAYEAVSYAWGSPKDVVTIQLDGHGSFLVTRNLRAALKRLRRQNSVRRLWADQICINQRNVSERNQQVAIMWTIFNEAAKVIVWLGEPGGPVLKLSKSYVEGLTKTPYADEMRYLIEHPSLHNLGSWWSRSWVVQEFVSARTEPAIYFGPYKLDWAVFRDKCWNQPHKSWHSPESRHALYPVLTMGQRFADLRELSHRGRTTILSLDWALLQTECSDPRDKLYSLLGLLSQAERDAITVDYAKDTRETFTIATQAFLAANKSYGVLHLITSARRSSHLPTWVVDFSLPTDQIITLGSFHIDRELAETFASEPRPWLHNQPCTLLKARYEPLYNSLSVTGLLFDLVVGVIPLRPPYSYKSLRKVLARKLRRVGHSCIRHSRHKKHLRDTLRNQSPYEHLSANTRSGREASSTQVGTEMFSRIQAFRRPSTSLMPHFIAEAVLSIYMETILCKSDDIWEVLFHWDSYLYFAREGACLLVTKCGFLCFGPATAKEHDVVILPYGSRHPMLLRPRAEDAYTFQSFVYVFGIMEEELIKTCPDLELEEMEFKIV